MYHIVNNYSQSPTNSSIQDLQGIITPLVGAIRTAGDVEQLTDLKTSQVELPYAALYTLEAFFTSTLASSDPIPFLPAKEAVKTATAKRDDDHDGLSFPAFKNVCFLVSLHLLSEFSLVIANRPLVAQKFIHQAIVRAVGHTADTPQRAGKSPFIYTQFPSFTICNVNMFVCTTLISFILFFFFS